MVTVSECGSHAVIGAVIGGTVGKGCGEQVLARQLYPRLAGDWLLIAWGWAMAVAFVHEYLKEIPK